MFCQRLRPVLSHFEGQMLGLFDVVLLNLYIFLGLFEVVCKHNEFHYVFIALCVCVVLKTVYP